MHEVDFKSNSLIQKESTVTLKYRHILCYANDYTYSIGVFNGLAFINDNWKHLPTLHIAIYAELHSNSMFLMFIVMRV